jgi:hypothetical protein
MRCKYIGLLFAVLLPVLWPTTADAAVTFRSKSAVVNTNGTSPTITEPAGCASGDAVLAIYLTDVGGNPALPAGWTSLYNGSATTFQYRVGYTLRGGSAPSYAFTHTGNIYRELHVMCFTGSATLALDSQSSSGATSNSSSDFDPPATTPVQTTSLAIAGGADWSGSTTAWTQPAGYALISDNSAGNDAAIATKSLASTASEDPGVFTGRNNSGGASDKWAGFTITFTDASGGAAPSAPKLMLLGVGGAD